MRDAVGDDVQFSGDEACVHDFPAYRRRKGGKAKKFPRWVYMHRNEAAYIEIYVVEHTN